MILVRPLVYKKVTFLYNILCNKPTHSLTERLILKEDEKGE